MEKIIYHGSDHIKEYLWILPGRALENEVPCAARHVRHLAQKTNRKFYLTIRRICTIIAIR